ncbi:MAG TPA: NADP-specific glutamate dehydrogenase [Gemmatimonadota bacterium]|nr:NADP-specific glutamate dehydrogenase [Gemmatimonadota bacterium]
MEEVIRRSGGEPEFHQAVHEVAESVIPVIEANPRYREARILERMTEPDRVIMFRVVWEDDSGAVQVNRGYRVQFNNAIGPYKGGLRFDPSVNLSILKFLGFEQTLKNSLTTLPMGGAKGGSDFNPKGRSDDEVMRFCQSFMTGLFRYIGKDVDVPAGDIGVGAREIGYLFGQYKRLQNEWTGALTGKGAAYGGSLLRTEATGYGAVYFAREMLGEQDDDLEGRTCVVSGSGNVAQYAAQKLLELGARVVSFSDRQGTVYEPDGVTADRLAWLIDLKTNRHGSLSEYAGEFGLEWREGEKPWSIPAELAFPCATQNEIQEKDAMTLAKGGCRAVCEGANMPVSPEGARVLATAGILHGPGKAVNAGGVAISGLEMTQNAIRMSWSREEIDERLQRIMRRIHEQCLEHGRSNGRIDYVRGANVAGFLKVADAMLAYGVQ